MITSIIGHIDREDFDYFCQELLAVLSRIPGEELWVSHPVKGKIDTGFSITNFFASVYPCEEDPGICRVAIHDDGPGSLHCQEATDILRAWDIDLWG